jgi:hypothetical protein
MGDGVGPATAEVVVMVTGGSGLVGKGIQAALNTGRAGPKPANERWVLLTSKDADLRDRCDRRKLTARSVAPLALRTSARCLHPSFVVAASGQSVRPSPARHASRCAIAAQRVYPFGVREASADVRDPPGGAGRRTLPEHPSQGRVLAGERGHE